MSHTPGPDEPVTVSDLKDILTAHAVASPALPTPPQTGIIDQLKQVQGLLVTIGLAACGWAFLSVDSRVEGNSEAIQQMVPIVERLVALQEGDKDELDFRREWMDGMNAHRSETTATLGTLGSRLDRVEELQSQHYLEHRGQ